jgi:hypothetical protein
LELMPANDWGIAMLLPVRLALLTVVCSGLLVRPALAQDCPTVCDASGACQTDCSSTVTPVPEPQATTSTQAVEDDSCEWAFDDVCDEPSNPGDTTSACPAGTDHTDCAGDKP